MSEEIQSSDPHDCSVHVSDLPVDDTTEDSTTKEAQGNSADSRLLDSLQQSRKVQRKSNGVGRDLKDPMEDDTCSVTQSPTSVADVSFLAGPSLLKEGAKPPLINVDGETEDQDEEVSLQETPAGKPKSSLSPSTPPETSWTKTTKVESSSSLPSVQTDDEVPMPELHPENETRDDPDDGDDDEKEETTGKIMDENQADPVVLSDRISVPSEFPYDETESVHPDVAEKTGGDRPPVAPSRQEKYHPSSKKDPANSRRNLNRRRSRRRRGQLQKESTEKSDLESLDRRRQRSSRLENPLWASDLQSRTLADDTETTQFLSDVEALLFGMNQCCMEPVRALSMLERRLPRHPVALAWRAVLNHPLGDYYRAVHTPPQPNSDNYKIWGSSKEGVMVKAAKSLGLFNRALDSGLVPRARRSRLASTLLGQLLVLFPSMYVPGQHFIDNKKQGLRYFRSAAEAGCPLAQCQLGHIYRLGRHDVKSDIDKAICYYDLASRQGMSVAQYSLGRCYFSLFEKKRHKRSFASKATEQFMLASYQGDANAQYTLGLCFQKGYGVTPSHARAVAYFALAAQQGCAEAQCHLGVYYLNGGVEDVISLDQPRAIALFRLAASVDRDDIAHGKGLPSAMNNLGVCFENGIGVDQPDEDKAVQYYQAAAAAGDPNAQCNLGEWYQKGRGGLDASVDSAAHYYRLAAGQGHTRAKYLLGLCYLEGHGVAQNARRAVKCLQFASRRCYPPALCELGLCYSAGIGMRKPRPYEAVQCFKDAVRQGTPRGQYLLGVCYDSGQGVKQDSRKAAHFYRRAAAQGYALAQYNLACCYEEGRGIEETDQKQLSYQEMAVIYFRQAASQGLAVAQCNLARCLQHGLGVPEADVAEAMKWYHRAADEGKSASAEYNLALCYEQLHNKESDQHESQKDEGEREILGCTSDQNGGLSDTDNQNREFGWNLKQCVRYLQLSVAQGYPEAQCLFGQFYEAGRAAIDDNGERKEIVIEQCESQALHYYKLAAGNEHAEASERYLLLLAAQAEPPQEAKPPATERDVPPPPTTEKSSTS